MKNEKSQMTMTNGFLAVSQFAVLGIIMLSYGPSLKTPLQQLTRAEARMLGESSMVTISKFSICACVGLLILAATACQRGTETANTNVNMNINANTNTNANANTSTQPISSLAAREPEKYRATVVLAAETEGGEKTIGIPTLTADVARNGSDRRVAFKLPDGSDLIYLEKGDQHIVIAPARKQWAELTPEATGVQLQKLMTPGQLVAHLDKLNGIEKVGEEQLNGRTAEKYRYARTSDTKTSAGTVNAEAFFYIDKETGLPLRSEVQAEASGNVQGMKGARIVAEMRDITTNVDSATFEVPQGYDKVPPEQVKQQIDAVKGMAGALIKALLAGSQQPSASPAASPAVSSSPAR
jgi:hypothetical protein